MNHTPNLQLPQWEASDRIHHDDFNDAFQTLDTAVSGKSSIVFGTFSGDGTTERTVTLGFTPRIVYTCTRWGTAGQITGSEYCYGGLAEREHPVVFRSENCIEIVSGGFVVRAPDDYTRTNCSNEVYYYIAVV